MSASNIYYKGKTPDWLVNLEKQLISMNVKKSSTAALLLLYYDC
jgi:hypothetical protein